MTKSTGSLLTSEEKTICEQISKSNEIPQSQRAQALLAINEGVTQAKAGEQTGLTIGQVRYCLQRFRQLRTASIFSTEKQKQPAKVEAKAASQSDNTESATEDSTNESKIASKKADKKLKDKKPKKNKKDKKKNDKKDKKDKKKNDKKARKKSGKSKKSKKQKK